MKIGFAEQPEPEQDDETLTDVLSVSKNPGDYIFCSEVRVIPYLRPPIHKTTKRV